MPRTGMRAVAALAAAMAGGLWGAARADAQGVPRSWRGRPEAGLPVPRGTGRLRNGARGLCLDVAGWAAQGDANVLLWECNNDPDQVWSFGATGELGNVLTGQCLDVAGYDGAPGANVDIFRCERLPDQRWTLVARGPGLFELHNLKRGLCLDVTGKAGAKGDNVLLWACDGGRDQLWSWEPYAAQAYEPPRPGGPPPGPPRGPQRPMRLPPDPREPPPELAVPTPPPPPPAPSRPREGGWRRQVRPMDDESFQALARAVMSAGFSENQLTVIEQASGRNYFRVAQLKSLLDLLGFSATKLRALELVAPRLVDPENAFAIYEAFSFTADKEQAKQILRRSGS